MVYENELIKQDELKIGDIYRKELLDFYASDYNCMLVIPNSPANISVSDGNSDYEVKQIIEDCYVALPYNYSLNHHHYRKVIVIRKSK